MRLRLLIRNVSLIALLLSPLFLTVGSLIYGLMSSGLVRGGAWSVSVLGLAGAFAALNLYLSFIRPWIYSLQTSGSMDGYKRASGAPLVGTLLVVISVMMGFGDWAIAAGGLLILALDVGGTPWFLAAVSRDRSFWE
ncbi:hypothetical protein [Acidovorax sp.]|uniref:hypothetical protein n=1 Tax=Acidovorax sp. TaxID=1872122 RepID=UPI00391A6C96